MSKETLKRFIEEICNGGAKVSYYSTKFGGIYYVMYTTTKYKDYPPFFQPSITGILDFYKYSKE